MLSENERTWTAATESVAQRLRLKEDGVELFIEVNQQDGTTTFIPFDQVKSFGFWGKSANVRIRKLGRWAFFDKTFEANSVEDRDAIVHALQDQFRGRCRETIVQNSFFHSLKTCGMVFVPFAAICGGALALLLVTTDAPSAGDRTGSKGGRMVIGMKSLAHFMGTKGILIFLGIVAIAWLGLAIKISQEKFSIHRFTLD